MKSIVRWNCRYFVLSCFRFLLQLSKCYIVENSLDFLRSVKQRKSNNISGNSWRSLTLLHVFERKTLLKRQQISEITLVSTYEHLNRNISLSFDLMLIFQRKEIQMISYWFLLFILKFTFFLKKCVYLCTVFSLSLLHFAINVCLEESLQIMLCV